MIQVKDLSYQYTNRKPMRFPDFELDKGAQCLIMSESGSGKTTLLHLLGGLLRTQQGSILIEGANLGKLNETDLDHFRGKHLGFVFQKNHLIYSLTVKENLLLSPYLAGIKQDPSRIVKILEQLGL